MFSANRVERSEYLMYLLNRNFVFYTGWICKKGKEKIMYIKFCVVNLTENHHLQESEADGKVILQCNLKNSLWQCEM
jgi:hypothetical protein